MKDQYQVIVIGGGQAGLSMSYLLKEKQLDHVVLEKSRVGESWRSQRWDTFCLVTPNWQCNLPGYSYKGKDPFGFMVKDEIVGFLENYVEEFKPPVLEGVEVYEVSRSDNGMFKVVTSAGTSFAGQVVVATGNFHFASFPEIAKKFSPDIVQLHSADYKNPQSLEGKEILVVGTGQSGCQIAEDLHLAGKRVHLCVGNAPRTARVYRGKDVVEWLDHMGYYDLPVERHPEGENVRSKTNHYVTGRDGGRDIDLRKFALEGMRLYGVLKNVDGDKLLLEENLKKNLDGADLTSENIKKKIDAYIKANKIDAPEEAPYQPVWEPENEISEINYKAEKIDTVVWCIGFGYDFSWIKFPVLDHKGLPIHKRGVTNTDGLYFLGLTWQHTWGSARFSGVAKDAQFLAAHIGSQAQQVHENSAVA